ncbi:MAG TPA: Rieske 2Fe-2S domain-containing protein [Pseudomonadales bacterium]
MNNLATLPRLPNGDIRYPRGWFIIGTSEDFKAGASVRMKYFEKELVGYRGLDDNAVHVLDGYCPHLGAHLGVGGIIEGNNIRCPFHAWQFDSSGQCVDIPYANRIPAKACLRTWHVHESHGWVFLWHDPEGNAPQYDIPVLEEFGDPEWSDWISRRLELKTHPREIIENVADKAHFVFVHGFKEVLEFSNIYEGHLATQIMQGLSEFGSISNTRATYYGPAYQITWMSSIFQSRLVNANTPIDANTVHLWFGVMLKKEPITPETKMMLEFMLEQQEVELGTDISDEHLETIQMAYVEGTRKGFDEDVAIWEHKLYRTDPVLCDGDGPLAKLRRWYAQFYTDVNQAR